MEPHRQNLRAHIPARISSPSPLPASTPRPTPTPCIRVTDLSLVFQGQTLCRHLDFTVPQGGINVLAPKDNLCKAALFELLAGRCSPAAGQCLICGHAIDEMPVDIRQQIGLLENSDRIYEVMTVGQTAIFFNGCFPHWSNDRYHALIDDLHLTRRMKISNLSHQQRVLVALAVLLARNPQLLVIDDWITGLDPATRGFIYQALHRFRSCSGATTLLLGHHAGLGPHLIDHLILVGHSTALTLPSAELFGNDPNLLHAAPTPPASTTAGLMRGGNTNRAQ